MPKSVNKKLKIKDDGDDAIDKEFDALLKEREKNDDISESLREIYEDDSPLVVVKKDGENKEYAMKKNSTVKRREANSWAKLAWTFLVFLLMISVISWALFYIFNQGNRMNSKDIELKLFGPENAAAGEELVYEIQYKNLSEFNLKNAEIYFQYPENFILIDAVPEFLKKESQPSTDVPPTISGNYKIWQFDQIDSKRSGRIDIKGKIINQLDSKNGFYVEIKYRPENFSSTFSASSEMETKIDLLGIDIEIEAPSFFSINEESEFVIKYTKQKDSFIDNFNVVLEKDDSFEISSDDKSGKWAITSIKDSQEKFIIKGAFTKKPAEGEKLKILLAVTLPVEGEYDFASVPLSGTAARQMDYVFYEYEILPIVSEGALSLTLTANGSSADRSVNFGDTINYVAHYKNTSDASLKNVIIMAVIDSKVVDWSAFEDNSKGDRKDNIIIWTKEEIKGLSEVSPSEEESFSFSIRVKTRDEAKNAAMNDLLVKTSLDYSINSAIKNNGTPAAQITSKINSDLQFSNELRYFDREGLAAGEGPLPPKVGEKTIFKAYWTLTNNLHDLKNIKVSAELPSYVTWENNNVKNTGKASYDSSNRKVFWEISDWDAAAEPAFLNFSISITPSESDRNKILTILNQTTVEATDQETGGIIFLTGKAKTSNLEDDSVGKGYGRVE
ncbi:MAG: hypothetical protein WC323_02030 [Patescibacteria group bacterium]|jgi:hypothetical protein